MEIIKRVNKRELIKLDSTQGFYNLLPSSEINATFELHLDDHDRYLGVEATDKWGIHLFVRNLSVVWFYADKRGAYLEYWSPIGGSDFTLHIQWKEFGIRTTHIPESIVKNYLPMIKNKMMTTYFEFMITRGSKCRRAIIEALRSIETEERMWHINNEFSIIQEGNLYHLYRGRTLRRGYLPLEAITRNLLT